MDISKLIVPGGFNDVTFADDVKPDRYRMVFGMMPIMTISLIREFPLYLPI